MKTKQAKTRQSKAPKCENCGSRLAAYQCDACGDFVCEACAEHHALDSEELVGICSE